jgi:hypothetical protein
VQLIVTCIEADERPFAGRRSGARRGGVDDGTGVRAVRPAIDLLQVPRSIAAAGTVEGVQYVAVGVPVDEVLLIVSRIDGDRRGRDCGWTAGDAIGSVDQLDMPQPVAAARTKIYIPYRAALSQIGEVLLIVFHIGVNRGTILGGRGGGRRIWIFDAARNVAVWTAVELLRMPGSVVAAWAIINIPNFAFCGAVREMLLVMPGVNVDEGARNCRRRAGQRTHVDALLMPWTVVASGTIEHVPNAAVFALEGEMLLVVLGIGGDERTGVSRRSVAYGVLVFERARIVAALTTIDLLQSPRVASVGVAAARAIIFVPNNSIRVSISEVLLIVPDEGINKRTVHRAWGHRIWARRPDDRGFDALTIPRQRKHAAGHAHVGGVDRRGRANRRRLEFLSVKKKGLQIIFLRPDIEIILLVAGLP